MKKISKCLLWILPNPIRTIVTVLVLACFSLYCPANATNVFNLDGYGPISRSMGGTGVSYDIGSYGLMINPATLALIPSKGQVDLGLDVITPHIKTKNLLSGEVAFNRRNNFINAAVYAPQLGIVRRIKTFTCGVGAFAQGGVGCDYGNKSFLSDDLRGQPTLMEMSSKLMVLRFPVGVAVSPHRRVIIGGSIDPVVQGINLNDYLQGDQLGSMSALDRVNGSLLPVISGIPGVVGGQISAGRASLYFPATWGVGISGKLGAVVKITERTRLGGVFHFPTAITRTSGQARLTPVSAVLGPVPIEGRIAFKNVKMPAQMTFGLSQDYKRFLGTAEFSTSFWQPVMKDFRATFTDSLGRTLNRNVPMDFKNSYVMAYGAQYAVSRKLSVRAGFAIGNNVVSKQNLLALVPAFPCRTFTCGTSYNFSERTTLQFAYSHTYMMQMESNSLPNVSMAAPISIQHAQNNYMFNLRYRF